MAPNIVEGIRQMPVVRDNPQWWELAVFDGFGSHLTGLRAMKVRDENKILSLKEEGDSSHVNQAYDRFVARSDKAVEAESLTFLRRAKSLNKGVVDQWGLVHVGLACLQETNKMKYIWTNSFRACNMDPRTQLSFPE